MSGEPVVSALLVGFVLGLQHAADPDHLVAVATIVSRERRFGSGALIGLAWGAGHATTLTLVGGALVAFNVTLGPGIGRGLELLVAGMIIALGAFRLRDALRGLGAAPPAHLLADHEHASRGAFHSHSHLHGHHVHAHPHVHPPRRLLGVLGGRGRTVAGRAYLVGAMHGLAGTAALSLLVLATLRSRLSGLVYLAVFALASLGGMTALTAVMAYPVALASRFARAHRALGLSAGAGAIAFGVLYAVRLVR